MDGIGLGAEGRRTVCLGCFSEPTIASADLSPHLGINRKSAHAPGGSVEKSSVMIQLSISEEPRQHSESARGQGLIYEGLLSIESFDGRATRQRVFTGRSIDDLGIQLTDRAQPRDSPPIP